MADFGFFPASTHSASGWNSSTMASIKEQAKELPLYKGASKMSEVWLPVIIIVGLVGNFLTVLVMMQRSNRWNSCSNYIAALAVSDSIALLRKSVDLWVGSSDVRYTEESCKACVYIALTACQYSMLLVLCLTVDRMIAVKYPNRSSVYCSVCRARIVMVGLLVPALLFNIPHIFFTKPIADGRHCATFDGGTDTSSLIYGVLNLIINSIIPLIALLTMTIIILKTLTKNRKMRERVRSTEETKGDGGRRSTPNFIIYIMTDGLFHFVMAYAANLFKDVEKQMSSSNSTLPTSKDSANSNRVSLTSSEGPRGTPNKAYDMRYEEPDVFDGEGKSKDQGRYNPAYSPTEKSVECRVYDLVKSPSLLTDSSREFHEHSECSEANEEGISRHQNQVGVDMNMEALVLKSLAEVEGRNNIGEYELTDQRRGVCGGTVLCAGQCPAHQEDCPPNPGVADPDLTPSADPLPLEEEDYIGTRPMALRRQASRERSRQMTVMLLLVVLFFFILTVPQSVRYILYNGHILDRTSSPEAYASYMLVYHISNKALFTNCAVNFFLYFFGSSLFRESLKETLTCCCSRRRERRRQEVVEEELPETAVPTVSEACHAHSGGSSQEPTSSTVSITEATSSSTIVYSTYM